MVIKKSALDVTGFAKLLRTVYIDENAVCRIERGSAYGVYRYSRQQWVRRTRQYITNNTHYYRRYRIADRTVILSPLPTATSAAGRSERRLRILRCPYWRMKSEKKRITQKTMKGSGLLCGWLSGFRCMGVGGSKKIMRIDWTGAVDLW